MVDVEEVDVLKVVGVVDLVGGVAVTTEGEVHEYQSLEFTQIKIIILLNFDADTSAIHTKTSMNFIMSFECL